MIELAMTIAAFLFLCWVAVWAIGLVAVIAYNTPMEAWLLIGIVAIGAICWGLSML